MAIANISHVRVSGAGAILMRRGALASTLHFDNASDLVVSGLSFDYERLPFTFGSLVSIQPSGDCVNLTFDVLNASLSIYKPPSDSPEQQWLRKVESILEYDATMRRPAARGIDIYQLTDAFKCVFDGVGGLVVMNVPKDPRFALGQLHILRHQVYSFQAIELNGGSGITLLDIEIKSTAGMGVTADQTRDIVIDGLRIHKVDDRPMSTNSDGVHLNSCMGGVTITNSLFNGQGDDGINVPSHFFEISRIEANGTILSLLGRGNEATSTGIVSGDTIEFRDRRTFVKYFTTTVASVSNGGSLVSLSSRPPAEPRLWDLILDVSQTPSWIRIQNNTFSNNRARGALVKAANALVVGNTFDGVSGPAVQQVPDGCYWFEGDAGSNWTFVNNTVVDCNYGAAANSADVYISSCVPIFNQTTGVPLVANGNVPNTSGVFRNITIAGNFFHAKNGQAAVSLAGVANGVLANNTVRVSGTPASNGNFRIMYSSGIGVRGNDCALMSSGVVAPLGSCNVSRS